MSLRTALAVATVILLAETTPGSLLQAQTGPSSPNSSPGGQSELGMKVGIGPFHHSEGLQPGNRTSISVEACLRCSSRALFVEYSHWTKPSASYATQYRSADTVTAGLRFQGRKRIRPFLDVGVAFGNARWGEDDVSTIGGVVGAGVTINPADRFYLRFGGRYLVMSQLYMGGDVAVGAGWRF